MDKQTKLKFGGVDIINVLTNIHRTLGSSNEEREVDVDCSPYVIYAEGKDNEFNILMNLSISSKHNFEIKVTAVGFFEINEKITEEIKKSFINTNAPAIMFPYVRSFITTLTSNMGHSIGTICLPPHSFNKELPLYDPTTIDG